MKSKVSVFHLVWQTCHIFLVEVETIYFSRCNHMRGGDFNGKSKLHNVDTPERTHYFFLEYDCRRELCSWKANYDNWSNQTNLRMDSSNCTCQELINKNWSYDLIKHCEQRCIIIITFIVINNQIKEMGHLNSLSINNCVVLYLSQSFGVYVCVKFNLKTTFENVIG